MSFVVPTVFSGAGVVADAGAGSGVDVIAFVCSVGGGVGSALGTPLMGGVLFENWS